LSADAGQVGARDRVTAEVRYVEYIAVRAAPGEVRRPAQQDREVIPGEQRFSTRGIDPPDFIRRVTGDVQVSRIVERQAVRQPADRFGVDFAGPEFTVTGQIESIDAVRIAPDHEQ